MKNPLKLLLITAAFGTASAFAGDSQADCEKIAASVNSAISADKAEVLNVVSSNVGQAPSCACEIVKAAIAASEASNDLVGQIVETAVTAAPDQGSLIAQCATSAAPGALPQIRVAIINAGGIPAPGGENPLNFPGDVAGGGGVNGGDQNSGAGSGSNGGDNSLPVNQSPETEVVTDPNPVSN